MLNLKKLTLHLYLQIEKFIHDGTKRHLLPVNYSNFFYVIDESATIKTGNIITVMTVLN